MNSSIITGRERWRKDVRRFAAVPISLFILVALWSVGLAGEGPVKRKAVGVFSASVEAVIDVDGRKPDWLGVVMPLPETNHYQDVVHQDQTYGQIMLYPETGGSYLYFLVIHKGGPRTLPAEAGHRFQVTLYEVTTDFSEIATLYPYRKDTELYRKYTGKNGDYIDPDHREIRRIANALSAQANDLDFARRAYDYVAANFLYLNPRTDLYSLDQIFSTGGGDCANLSSLFISLLRHRGIPARHLVGIKPGGDVHVFAEFYLENYGWIPVDVTYRRDKPHIDYFGVIREADVMVVFSTDVNLTVKAIADQKKVPMMQSFRYWWRNSRGTAGQFSTEFHFDCRKQKQ